MTDITNEAIILENERVVLRPLLPEDAKHFLYFSENEPSIWTFSLVEPAGGIKALDHYINLTYQQKLAGKEYPFIVFDKKAHEYAGCTRFYDINPFNKTVQLGYTWYGLNFQRTGLNRNCKLLLLEFAFEKWGMERVEFRADANNKRSIEAMKGIGCTVEGILRSHMPLKKDPTVRRDTIILSILKQEWFNTVKRNLTSKIY